MVEHMTENHGVGSPILPLGISIVTGIGAVGSALGLGPRGREFESRIPD